MSVIAVVNRKGGSGKSTIATHLAVHLTAGGEPVMLGDIDRQRSTQSWLKRRKAAARSRITGWPIEPKAMVRPPASGHVVLDTPGGLTGFDLARVVMYADAILVPVCGSAFDRDSAADCLAELQTLPRVASGRCKVAAVGMRIEPGHRHADALTSWARSVGVTWLGVLRDSASYVRAVEEGLTLFDLPRKQVKHELTEWAPVLRWVDAALADAGLATRPGPAAAPLAAAAPVATPVAVLPASALPAAAKPGKPVLAALGAGREAAPLQPARMASPAVPAFLAKTLTGQSTPGRLTPVAATLSAASAPLPGQAAAATPRALAPVTELRPVDGRGAEPDAPLAPLAPAAAETPRRSSGTLGGISRLLGGLPIPRFLQRDRAA